MSDLVPASESVVGLEDIDSSDLTMPRLRIDHSDAVFVDNLSGERWDKLNVIVLGLIKQRVLWPPEMDEEGAPPLCRSYDHNTGHPGEKFPWKATSLDPVGEGETISCATCPLKEWGSHPSQDKPWCSEQAIFAVLLEGTSPALVTFQRSGMKPARSYMSSFVRSKQPMFTAWTEMALTAQKRGTVKYAVPTFAKGDATSDDEHAAFAAQYMQIRDFLQTPFTPEDDGGSSTPSTPPAAASGDKPTDEEGDDLPF